MRRFAIWIAVGTLLLVLGFATGYGLSSSWGRELLRHEVEQILSDVMHGEVEIDEVRVVLSHGLALHGRGLRVYASEGGPGLQAREAYIELNEPAALLGDFDLALLVLDEVVLQAGLEPDGSWTFPPLQALQDGTIEEEQEEGLEPVLPVLAGAERVGRELLERTRIADRIVVRDGAIHFEDHAVTADAGAGTELQRFRLEHIDGILTRPWLSKEGQLALTATFLDPSGHEVPTRVTAFVREGEIEIALAVADFDLDAVDAYVDRLSQEADLEGTLSGEIRLQAAEPGFQRAEVDVALQDVAPTVVLGGEPVRSELPVATLQARLEVEPGLVRIVDAHTSGPRVELAGSSSIARPISRESDTRIEAQLRGIGMEDVWPIAAQLPDSGETLRLWFGRIDSGTVDSLSISGSTNLGAWGQLLEGELSELPAGFLVGLRVSNVTARLGDDEDRLTGASFQAEWAGDRLELRKGRGTWRGALLPEIDLTLDGLSRFVDMQPSPYDTNAAPLPGLPLAWELLLEDPEDHEASEASANRFGVEIDYLDHPILQWPVENARMTVQPIPHGTESVVTEATWGGVPVIAEVVYLLHPEPFIAVGVQAAPRSPTAPRPGPRRTPNGPWGRGRFHLEPAATGATGPSMLSHMKGDFVLTGSTIRFARAEVAVSQSARVTAEFSVDLGKTDRLPVGFEGRIDDADLDHLAVALGLPEGFITGKIDIEADIEGSLERDQNLYAGLEGTIHGEAEDGEIRQNVPVAVAMATVADGFNPFAKRDRLKYETIETDMVLDHGRLTAEKMELEGPVRIYATGTLDFAEPPEQIDAVVGVFLFQRVRELLGKVPLVNLVLPGSDKGWVGAYYRVHGPWDEPTVDTMTLKSLKEGIPDIITKPFEILDSLWKGSDKSKQKEEKSGKKKRKQETDAS